MTVAVSTASALEQILSVVPAGLRRPDRDRLRVDRPDHDRQPARPARVGQHLRGPDLPVRRAGAAHDRASACSTSSSGTGVPIQQTDVFLPPATETLTLFLLLKAFAGGLGRADRRRGDRERGAGVQAARGEERGQHADRDVDPARDPVHRDHRRGARLRRPADPAGRRRRSSPWSPGRSSGRARCSTCLPGRDRAHPVPGREHELQRVPAPGRDPRRGRLHAAPVLRSAATGWPTPGGSSLLAGDRVRAARRSSAATPTP